MTNIDNNRKRLLEIYKFLWKYTDDKHSVTVAELIDHLESVGIKGNRNTIREDISALIEVGFDVISEVGPNNTKRYHVGSRTFDLVELKILVDAVASSHFISNKKSFEMVGKISKLTSNYEAKELLERVNVFGRVKTDNPQLLYTVDSIDKAIKERTKVRFRYRELNPNKEMVYRHDGEWYVISPYAVVWNEDRYYMLGYSDKHKCVTAFRIDWMCIPEILDERGVPMPEDFSVSDYMEKSFNMFSGTEKRVVLEFPRRLTRKIVDRFGMDIDIEDVGGGKARAIVDVMVANTFFGWLLIYGGEIKLIGPPEVCEEYQELLSSTLEKNLE